MIFLAAIPVAYWIIGGVVTGAIVGSAATKCYTNSNDSNEERYRYDDTNISEFSKFLTEKDFDLADVERILQLCCLNEVLTFLELKALYVEFESQQQTDNFVDYLKEVFENETN